MRFDASGRLGAGRWFQSTRSRHWQRRRPERRTIVSTPPDPHNPDPRNQDPQQPGRASRPVPPPPPVPPHAGQHGQLPPQYGSQPPYSQPQYGSQPPYSQPPYDGGQYGQAFGQPAAPVRKNRKVLWIVLGAVGGVVLLAVVGVVLLVNLVGNATAKARSQAQEFTKLLLDGRNEEAYDRFLTDSLKEDVSKAAFLDGIGSLELSDSCKANYNSVNAESKNGVNRAEVSGTLDCSGRTIELKYGFVGNDGKMDAIRIKPRG